MIHLKENTDLQSRAKPKAKIVPGITWFNSDLLYKKKNIKHTSSLSQLKHSNYTYIQAYETIYLERKIKNKAKLSGSLMTALTNEDDDSNNDYASNDNSPHSML